MKRSDRLAHMIEIRRLANDVRFMVFLFVLVFSHYEAKKIASVALDWAAFVIVAMLVASLWFFEVRAIRRMVKRKHDAEDEEARQVAEVRDALERFHGKQGRGHGDG